MKTLAAIALVGSVSMIALLEIGLRLTPGDRPAAEMQATADLVAVKTAASLFNAKDMASMPSGPNKATPAFGGRSEDALVFSSAIPAGLPRFSRSRECARLRQGTSPLKTYPVLRPQAQ